MQPVISVLSLRLANVEVSFAALSSQPPVHWTSSELEQNCFNEAFSVLVLISAANQINLLMVKRIRQVKDQEFVAFETYLLKSPVLAGLLVNPTHNYRQVVK